jgi:hypothetical protein
LSRALTKKGKFTPVVPHGKRDVPQSSLLAKPDKQWKTGYSAKALAYCWEEAKEFPDSVKKVFSNAPYPPFKGIVPLLVLPEYQVPLPGGTRPSYLQINKIDRMNRDLEERIQTLAQWLYESSYTVVFTGAGISTESGIPDFRGPDGVWTRQDKGLPPKPISKSMEAVEPNA